MKTSTRAFTLLELLVVIAIIGLVAGMLLPAMSKAKRKSQQASCSNSCRQLVLGAKMYADDYEVIVPVTADANNSKIWIDLLSPYLGNENAHAGVNGQNNTVIWGCPVYQETVSNTMSANNCGFGDNLIPDYPNGNANWNYKGAYYFKWDAMAQPSSHLVLGEASSCILETTTLVFRHNLLANFAFFDCHVEPLKTNQAYSSYRYGTFQ